MQELTVVTRGPVQPLVKVEVRCETPDLELLFVEWLNAVIYEMALRGMLFGHFAVRIGGARLEGTLWGEPVDVERHAPEPKGATYTAPNVTADHDGCGQRPALWTCNGDRPWPLVASRVSTIGLELHNRLSTWYGELSSRRP